MKNPIPIVDIFAGPGGLGEGFCTFENSRGEPVFEPVLAAEMDHYAHKTLVLRTFFRSFPKGKAPESYYKYIAGQVKHPYTDETFEVWERARQKCLRVQLGDAEDDELFDRKMKKAIRGSQDWVLLGGPPCQAYSTIRRWQFRSDDGSGHDIDRDNKAHLYKQYLRIIHVFCPTMFVMENVRGLLSSKYFGLIMDDLQKPNRRGERYRLFSLVKGRELETPRELTPEDYLIRSERYGVPQRRHRVIIVGVLERINKVPLQLEESKKVCTAGEVLSGLPPLRSGLSKGENSDRCWYQKVSDISCRLHESIGLPPVPVQSGLKQYSTQPPKKVDIAGSELGGRLYDKRLVTTPNHETRGHMLSDLERYYFAAMFAKKHKRTPRDTDFPAILDPDHKSWKTNKFNDRFRVQVEGLPSTTVVSHISKDGHSFIHYDPSQCRSLTVREAARLQTFPDNYYFEGPRTEQYKQVGNAVPPFLARQVAEIIADLVLDDG